ncbi:MAG TPA: ABC transporter permease [Candidatus Dormibacteraeota bacterium]|nr:ABC transporter permease [Candidatus Dormibacteraeota bacterium]
MSAAALFPEGREAPRAAPWAAAFWAQFKVELVLMLRQGENLLVILVLPVLLLVLFTSARIFPAGSVRPVDFLVPGILTVAVMSTGMVTLGISTAYQRYYRVLKRLGGSPLPRSALAAAKAAAVLLVEVVQVGLLVGIAGLGLGWSAHGSLGLAVLILLVGAVGFAGIGLALAAVVRAELTLGGANGLYLLFLILGGVVLPVDHLPSFVQPLASVLPATALSSSLRAVLEGAAPAAANLLLLGGWTAAAVLAAGLWFRWE